MESLTQSEQSLRVLSIRVPERLLIEAKVSAARCKITLQRWVADAFAAKLAAGEEEPRA